MKQISLVELFSGIGSQHRALLNAAKNNDIEIDLLNTCEWDIHSFIAYDIIHNDYKMDSDIDKLDKDDLINIVKNYNISNDGKRPISFKTVQTMNIELLKRIVSSIRNTKNFINVKDIKGKDLPNNLDVLTYSFPCQDLSNVGALHGYNKGIDRNCESRSGLLWEVERMLKERQEANLDLPKILLLENVTALEAKRHKSNFDEWQTILKDLGYFNKVYKLNALNFGIPQNRHRLLMISILANDEQQEILTHYFSQNNLENVRDTQKQLHAFLHFEKQGKYYKESLMSQPNNTKSRKRIWDDNSKIFDENKHLKNIVQTITTKQDRHPNSGNIYFDYEGNTKSKYRFLTPRECFQLMGFNEFDYQKIINNNFSHKKNSLFFSRDIMYKLAGNSIVVDVLVVVFKQALDILEIIDNS